MVETDGPDGSLATYEVKYTFGIEPLQQYLIELPGGRLQALSIAWDTRPVEQGGQRWFHLYPDEKIGHEDVLHWTKLYQNWNFMCAECHSTGVRKNYDPVADRYETTFAEISVGCEMCHGQGSRHIAWAKAKQSWSLFSEQDDSSIGLLVRYTERLNASWSIDEKSGSASRSEAPATLRKEVEACGLCHARRGQLSEDWKPGDWLSETHNVSPLSRGLYHADGQMLDEVYNYGSFKQSRMFAAGVTCSDCHDPHSAKLRVAGDGVCLQCHSEEKFAAASHHRHAGVTPALTCAWCHMPVRDYMVVDARHDHSFRVPRPDISMEIGTPNACNDCHKEKSEQWAATAIEGWHGKTRKGYQTYAPALHAAWTDASDAAALLEAVATSSSAPALARATALGELSTHVSPELMGLARSGLSDPDPMVRIGALDMLVNVPAVELWAMVSPLLGDPVKGVRIRAVQLLASVPTAQQPAADRGQFEKAAGEFIAAQRVNADRPEARSALGNYYAARNQIEEAETEFKAALRLSAHYGPAAVNLADLYRQTDRDTEGEAILAQALLASPQDAGVHHALGLTLARLKRLDDAIEALRKAAALAPERARYGYVYAIALNSAGRTSDALETLQKTAARHPRDRDTLMARIGISRDTGDIASAIRYAEETAAVFPEDEALAALIQALRRQILNPNMPK